MSAIITRRIELASLCSERSQDWDSRGEQWHARHVDILQHEVDSVRLELADADDGL